MFNSVTSVLYSSHSVTVPCEEWDQKCLMTELVEPKPVAPPPGPHLLWQLQGRRGVGGHGGVSLMTPQFPVMECAVWV